MNITTSQLENVKELGTVTAVSSFGTGFLTSIVSMFIELFGTENNMLGEKIKKAKDSAMNKIIEQAKAMGKADGIMNLKIELSGKTVLIYGVAYREYALTEKYATTTDVSIDDIPEI